MSRSSPAAENKLASMARRGPKGENRLARMATDAAGSGFMRGLTALPYRLLGAPVDLADMVVRPIASAAGIPIAEPENMYGTSDWMIKHAVNNGLLMPRTGSGAEMGGDFLGQLAAPGVGPGEAAAAKAIFAGPLALTADLEAMRRAQSRLEAGEDAAKVWADEGWFRAPDGKMRFEIDDSQAALTGEGSGDFVRRRMAEGLPARDAIDELRQREAKNGPMMQNYAMPGQSALPAVMSHPALFEAYPDTMATQYATRQEIPMGEGRYHPDTDAVFLGPTEPAAARSNMLHELQHGIQEREGFARGGGVEQIGRDLEAVSQQRRYFMDSLMDAIKSNDQYAVEFYNQKLLELGKSSPRAGMTPHEGYLRLAGEAEARAVQARRDLTPEQRRARYPLQDYDVPLNELIIR